MTAIALFSVSRFLLSRSRSGKYKPVRALVSISLVGQRKLIQRIDDSVPKYVVDVIAWVKTLVLKRMKLVSSLDLHVSQ